MSLIVFHIFISAVGLVCSYKICDTLKMNQEFYLNGRSQICSREVLHMCVCVCVCVCVRACVHASHSGATCFEILLRDGLLRLKIVLVSFIISWRILKQYFKIHLGYLLPNSYLDTIHEHIPASLDAIYRMYLKYSC
jgi:hypothetical protein